MNQKLKSNHFKIVYKNIIEMKQSFILFKSDSLKKKKKTNKDLKI